MTKFTYLFFLLVFSLPAVGIVFFRHQKIIKRYWKLFFPAIGLFVFYDVVSDPVGTSWHAWVYNTSLMLGTWAGGAAYETIILAVVLAMIFSLIVIVFAEKEEKGKPFRPFI